MLQGEMAMQLVNSQRVSPQEVRDSVTTIKVKLPGLILGIISTAPVLSLEIRALWLIGSSAGNVCVKLHKSLGSGSVSTCLLKCRNFCCYSGPLLSLQTQLIKARDNNNKPR